jgi:hypothetical protein
LVLEGPGVYVGLDLQEPAAVAHALEQVLVAIRTRLSAFAGNISASYLHKHVAPSLMTRWGDVPVDVLLKAVDQFKLVALGEPAR